MGYTLVLVRLPTVSNDHPTELSAIAEQVHTLEAAGFELPESYASFGFADASASITSPADLYELNGATIDRMLGADARLVWCSFELRGLLTPGLADMILRLAITGRMAIIPESCEMIITSVDLADLVDLPSLVEDGWPKRLVVLTSGDELWALLHEDVSAWKDYRDSIVSGSNL